MEFSELQNYWAALNRRLDALSEKLDALEALQKEQGPKHHAQVAASAMSDVAGLRRDLKRVVEDMAPVLARAADTKALAVVIDATPWGGDDEVCVSATAMSSFILTGGTPFMAKMEPDPWRKALHPDAIDHSRTVCGRCTLLFVQHDEKGQMYYQLEDGRRVRLCSGFRNVEQQEPPLLDPRGVLPILLDAPVGQKPSVGAMVLSALALFHREHGQWPTLQQVAVHLRWDSLMTGFLLDGLVTAQAVVQESMAPDGVEEKSAYALTFLGWAAIHRREG